MNAFFSSSLTAGVVLSLAAYFIGLRLQKRFRSPLVNPLLIAIFLTMGVLLLGGVDYAAYNASASLLGRFLTPATVCLAIPLYEKWQLLKENKKAVLLALIAGVLTSLVSVYLLSLLFGLTHEQYVTLLPKSITTAIGMGVSEELGGLPSLTAAVIIITGVLGNIFAETLCRLFKITHPVAKGLAIGASSHAIGTAKALEMGTAEGAMSGLAIAVCGVFTVILAPLFGLLI